MKMTLYDIDSAIENWEPKINEETGEVLNFSDLDDLNMARDAKIENIALYIKNLASFAEDIREEEKTLADRRKVIENKISRLKAYLLASLAGDKFVTSKVSISYRNSKSIRTEPEFIEWAKLNAPECIKYSISEDKTAIKNLLKEKENIPYVKVEENNNIQIR